MGALASVGALVTQVDRLPWFARCGTALGASECSEIEQYLRGLGLTALPIATVSTWEAAGATAQRADWSRAWWDAELREVEQLRAKAAAQFGEVPLLKALSELTEAAARLYETAALPARKAGVEDEGLIRAAAGAGAMAAHQMGLVLAAERPAHHPLACKYRLFASGHWLLGVMGERCYLF